MKSLKLNSMPRVIIGTDNDKGKAHLRLGIPHDYQQHLVSESKLTNVLTCILCGSKELSHYPPR